MVYMDDNQEYFTVMPKETWLDFSKKLETCLTDISASPWMSTERTELIIFTPEHEAGLTREISFW